MTPSKKKSPVPTFPGKWDGARLRSLLSGIQKKRILVVGDVGLDRYTVGVVERISPEAPVPIVRVQQEVHKLGLAANVADNLHALGGVSRLIGLVGADRAAQDFQSLLRKSGISHRYLLRDRARRTVLKDRIVSERQQLLRVDYEDGLPASPKLQARLLKSFVAALRVSDAVILEDYAKGLFSEALLAEMIAAAKAEGKTVAVDPNSKTPAAWYRGVSLLTPNTSEAEALSGVKITDDASLKECAFQILLHTQAEKLVITRGRDGMSIFHRPMGKIRSAQELGKSMSHIPTFAREVYDVSGAGDTVIAVLALVLSAGGTVEEAATLGNLAAGVEVGKRGTATVSCEEVLAAMEFFESLRSGA
jgi:rfaE bifunctional protein kinase chain/domain